MLRGVRTGNLGFTHMNGCHGAMASKASKSSGWPQKDGMVIDARARSVQRRKAWRRGEAMDIRTKPGGQQLGL